jgi:gamma-glutamyltranspeptidase/glutathione hydrolase
VLKDGRVIAYGTMGGDGQPQTQAAIYPPRATANRRARDRRAALCSAALGLDAHQRTDGITLRRQSDRPADVGGARHRVIDAPYSDLMGHAGAVVLHADGTLEGAHDPRADGGAAGV